jgi:hypothetical protein
MLNRGIDWDNRAFNIACDYGIIENINGSIAAILDNLTDDNIKNLFVEIYAVKFNGLITRFFVYTAVDGLHIFAKLDR